MASPHLTKKRQPRKYAASPFLARGSSFPFSESANPDAGDGFREIYQAPENLLGKSPSRRSEQFSAASIFYEMLTRKTPFNLAGKREFRIRPSKLLPGIPEATLLAKNRTMVYENKN